ncbi:hypothetical protein ACLVWU_13210 [Bdellovibrio sp. HCB290]|uniref:hypothetical protein n=1 Tax=Bdellovibrio sp. HCB290 TaxID=3394356 RepID=UPI0039B3D261
MGPLAEDLNGRQTLQASILIFDETLSIEHTKLKPLTIALAVNEKYQILGVHVGSLPAFGKIADISRTKYGPRANQSNEKVTDLLTQVKQQLLNLPSELRSDKKADYLSIAAKIFPTVQYTQCSSRGNKEKKREQKYLKSEKLIYDPLFPLNQRCAKIRDHIKRMARRNWCTTKKPQHLQWALHLYITKNNGYDLFNSKNFATTP